MLVTHFHMISNLWQARPHFHTSGSTRFTIGFKQALGVKSGHSRSTPSAKSGGDDPSSQALWSAPEHFHMI